MIDPAIAVRPEDIERQRKERAWRLNVVEIPFIRAVASTLISLGVWIDNRFLLRDPSLSRWILITIALVAFNAISWASLILFYRRALPRNLGFLFCILDVLLLAFAVYASGAEKSWLYFILLMPVAGQATTFRRCLGFVLLTTVSYAAMLTAVVLIDRRPIDPVEAVVKTAIVLLGGVLISIVTRPAERSRGGIRKVVRQSRELIARLDEQGRELRESRANAEEASAAKSEFLAQMSHEMRTPLHGIMGMLQLVEDDDASPDRRRRLEMARHSTEALLSTIDDILDFSKIEARKLEIEPVYFSIRTLTIDTMKPLAVTAAGQRLALHVRIAPDVPDQLWGDPFRIRQILVNLVGNAIKFTPSGEVSLSITTEGRNAGGVILRIEVRDTGIGIAPDKQDAIFAPFTQAGRTGESRFGSSGLGLSIVARLVEMMQGRIWVDSGIGRGSTFGLNITLECDPLGTFDREPWEASLAGARVVVLDPDVTERANTSEILAAHGIVPIACATRDEARRALAAHERAACVVVDSAELPLGASVPVVTVEPPLRRGSSSPIAVTRPIGERELIEAVGVASGLVARAVSYTLEPQNLGPPATPLRVLVADDHPVNLEFAAEALRRLGHDVAVASDGVEALARLQSDHFDLALLDMEMPLLDGPGVARRYRALESAERRTAILALTAHATRQHRERCFAAGMDGFITKPIDRTQLDLAIRQYAQSRDTAAPAPRPMPPDSDDAILEAVDGDVELLARISDAMARQTPRLLLEIREALGQGDGATVSRCAHTLKGASSNFGASGSVNLAAALEKAARDGDLARSRALAPCLEDEMAKLMTRIEAALKR
ncbi:MAG TPA: ATP-binding protein [Thermoanaerobaculia bacterium]|nr:ATP-binding protein [Thermoanaerobaculia bacterium]